MALLGMCRSLLDIRRALLNKIQSSLVYLRLSLRSKEPFGVFRALLRTLDSVVSVGLFCVCRALFRALFRALLCILDSFVYVGLFCVCRAYLCM